VLCSVSLESARDFWLDCGELDFLPSSDTPGPLSPVRSTDRVLTPQTAEAAAACQNMMQVLFLEMSPCAFFHIVSFHPKLT